MKTDLQASRDTYFSLLDKDSLFFFLSRLHYPDLISLCKAYNYLWKITCTSYFQEKWKEYNIRTVNLSHDKYRRTVQIDRLQVKHGSTYDGSYNGYAVRTEEYIQGVIQMSVERVDNTSCVTMTYTYIQKDEVCYKRQSIHCLQPIRHLRMV